MWRADSAWIRFAGTGKSSGGLKPGFSGNVVATETERLVAYVKRDLRSWKNDGRRSGRVMRCMLSWLACYPAEPLDPGGQDEVIGRMDQEGG
jgi:hypothetical protein